MTHQKNPHGLMLCGTKLFIGKSPQNANPVFHVDQKDCGKNL